MHEIHLQDQQFIQQSFSKIGYRIGLALILGFVIIGSAFSWVYGDANNKMDEIIFVVASFMSIITGARWMLKAR